MNHARALRGIFACVVCAASVAAGLRGETARERVANLHFQQLIHEAFPFRAKLAETPAPESNAILLEGGTDENVELLPELTVVASIRERHLNSAIERTLLDAKSREFDWRTGGTIFRKDFRKFSIESGLHWSLVSSAAGNPGLRLDLLKIAW